MDPRNRQLAEQLIHYSLDLKAGEKIYIEVKGLEALELGRELVLSATRAGGVPFWYYNDEDLGRGFIKNASPDQFTAWGDFHRAIMETVDAYVAVRGSGNAFDLADVDAEHMKGYDQAYWDAVHLKVRLKKKWCVLRYPNPAMAQLAQRPTEEFADFYYRVCTLDYARMSQAMDPLFDLMKKTDRVHIKGPGTDLRFSIAGIPPVKCDGHRNIPDGEVYTAPVRDSMNGTVQYNTATLRSGTLYRNLRFEVAKGRIEKASCEGDNAKLNQVLDTDEGARYFGEFSFGLNPFVTEAMLDTLFDEKIRGSFHLTPGNAYDSADNGNRSAIHWDLVCIQTPEHGGGEIWFDDRLIRKDGRFTVKELEGLNPENLA